MITDNSYATQVNDGMWGIYCTSKDVPDYQLPAKLTEIEALMILKIIQKASKEAYEQGKKDSTWKVREELESLQRVSKDLVAQNTMLRNAMREE